MSRNNLYTADISNSSLFEIFWNKFLEFKYETSAFVALFKPEPKPELIS